MTLPFNISSVKARLILLAIFGLGGFSAILLGNLSFFSQTNDKLSDLQNIDLRTVQIANDLQLGMSDMNRLFEASVVEGDQDTLVEALKLAEIHRGQLVELGQLNSGLKDESQRLIVSFNVYINEIKQYIKSVLSGRYEGDEMYGAFSEALQKRELYEQGLRKMGKIINVSFSKTLETLRENSQKITQQQFTYATLLFLVFVLAVIWFIRMINKAIDSVIGVSSEISQGNLDVQVEATGAEELKRLFSALDIMRSRLKQQHLENKLRQSQQTQLAVLNETLRGEKDIQQLADDLLKCIAANLGNLVGAFYLLEEDELVLKASYAYTYRKGLNNRFALGESLVGQAALEQKLMVVEGLPADYSKISSGLGDALPGQVVICPLVINGHLLGALELMMFRAFSEEDIDYLQKGSEGMAIAVHSAISRVELSKALGQTREQADALERQQEELRATNEELEEQAAILRASEENLQQQQEELRVMNEELAERNSLLDRQKEEIERNNAALERSRQDLQDKAKQLELSGRYKSEFLSTMSHELRTPLNSILILSQGLMENKKHNLDDKQIEHAQVINSSGRDLLLLINDILDLSKVEEGKLELVPENLSLTVLADKIKAQFDAQAEGKGLAFCIDVAADLSDELFVDEQRLTQILRNFLSNAFKFTHKGEITLAIEHPNQSMDILGKTFSASELIAFHVKDTGIGIPAEKQRLIFEAFQQVDGTISRKYGGTGLGLTISRKLAELMDGTIDVFSLGENQGTTFSLIIPIPRGQASKNQPVEGQNKEAMSVGELQTVTNDQHTEPAAIASDAISQPSNAILIVEDDLEFCRIIHGLAEEFGFSATSVHTVGDAFSYLERSTPESVILDLGLPDAPGQQLLSHLKSNPLTSGIPVHVISGNTEVSSSDLVGAQEFIVKPFGRERLNQLFTDIGKEISPYAQRGVLIIEDDPVQCEQLQSSFSHLAIHCDMACTGEEAQELFAKNTYGAIILDLDLPDCNGFELLNDIGQQKDRMTHIIIYTARDLTKKQDAQLRRYADRIVLKTDQSIHRLLNETSLFLHWLKDDKQAPEPLTHLTGDPLEEDKHILLVDDDIRNLYSISSVLEDGGLEVSTASNGVEALEILQQDSGIDLVLMDIMMPEMDGFEAMEKIRAMDSYQQLPIIALTAKAMRDDRARCIEAGANDYLSKPVEPGKLKAIIKLWLHQT
ncbi:MAG: response regulator [Pseudomonadales bacterium]|nr:response regulator [Pseudomonadales bacterium]